MDYASLKSHLGLRDEGRWPGVFSEDGVTVYTPGQRMGLQIADAVASGYYLALEPNPYGDTEDAYARGLLPKAASIRGGVWDEGVTIVPEEVAEKERGGSLDHRV